jgi:hypothetical protein
MKKYLLVFVALFIGSSASAQKIYVEKTDGGYEQPILDKLISNNYKITFKKDSADYVIMCIIGSSGIGRSKGSIAIVDNKSGNLLVKSKEVTGQTSAFNGYANTKMLSMKKIADKYLIDLLNSIIKK